METNTETKKTKKTKIVQLQVEDAQAKFQQAETLRLEAEEKAKQAARYPFRAACRSVFAAVRLA